MKTAVAGTVGGKETDDVTRRLAGYTLALGEGWLLVPGALDDADAWSRQTAAELVEKNPSLPESSPLVAKPADPVDSLARRLGEVVGAASATGVDALSVAVLVRRPALGDVDAMLTIVGQAGLSAERFTADLERIVAESDDPPYLAAQEIDATVSAGSVRGAHLMIGHVDPDLGEGVAHLEERVSLGIFPPDSPDMLEVTVIANGSAVFVDMAQAVVDLLGGLTVELAVA
jgi:hypothetical protein